MTLIRFKRGTRAQLDAAAASSLLNNGEPYFITDEGQVAVGTSATTYSDLDIASWDKLVGNLSDEEAELARVVLRAQKQENGYENRTDSTLAFVNATRTFSVAPVGASFAYYHNGNKYTKTTAQTIQIPNVEGLHYIYFDGASLVTTQTFTMEIITEFAFTAAIYWDATNNKAILFEDERHGSTMDSATHAYNHSTFGTRYGEGLGLTDIVTEGTGNAASDAQFGVGGGSIWDEDIHHVIAHNAPQPLVAPAQIPVFYRSGAAGHWRRVDATTYPVATAGTGRVAYNNFDGATWSLLEADNANYVLYHYFATGDSVHPIIALVGQAQYNTRNGAQDAATVEINELEIGALETLSPEYLPLATVIFETRTVYSNAVKARVRETGSGDSYIDWREGRSGAGAGSGSGTAWGDITGVLANQTDLQTALNTKLTAASNLSDLQSAATARTNLGLGTAATQDATTASYTGTPYDIMRVGDYGLGRGDFLINFSLGQLDGLDKTGFYTTGNLFEDPSVLWHGQYSSNYASQMIVPTADETAVRGIWFRHKAGTWQPWQRTPILGTGANDTRTNAEMDIRYVQPLDLQGYFNVAGNVLSNVGQTINHATVASPEVGTSQILAFGGTFNNLSSIVMDGYGHVSERRFTQYTLPSVGTAAASDVTTGPTDTTTGRLLKVGDFGTPNPIPLPSLDFNQAITTGFYAVESTSAVNGPDSGLDFGFLQVYQRLTSTRIYQQYYNAITDSVYFRYYTGTVWQPWRELYHTGNLLGTVSQSGGVPTGAVIERGSNANGEYVKFADGTMICTRSLAIAAASYNADTRTTVATSVTLPANFSVTPVVVAENISGWAGEIFASVEAPASSRFGANVYLSKVLGGTRTTAVTIALTAIGRWF